MNRITLHHTGGGYRAGKDDIQHYHRIVEGDGRVVSGVHRIEANAPGQRLRSGQYAAHTRALNTGNIGVAVAAMGGSSWHDPSTAELFPTRDQMQALVAEVARLATQYGIPVERRTVLSHAEVEPTLGVWQHGKWDFDYDPFGVRETRDPIRIGDELRTRIRDAMGEVDAVYTPERRMLAQGDRGNDVRLVQRVVGVRDDGIFGPVTRGAVKRWQREHDLLNDGIVGPMTWAAMERWIP